MTDNKKVIDGQKEVIMYLLHMSEMCSENDEPYYDKLRNYAINTWALLENLLKEQELNKLMRQETTFEKDGHHIRCVKCNSYWCITDCEGNTFPMNYCPECGRKVKWND